MEEGLPLLKGELVSKRGRHKKLRQSAPSQIDITTHIFLRQAYVSLGCCFLRMCPCDINTTVAVKVPGLAILPVVHSAHQPID